MKIQGKGTRYISVDKIICNTEISFDDSGIAEVEDKVGEEILAKFPDLFFEEGNVPQEEESKEDNDKEKEDGEKVLELEKKLQLAKEEVEDLKDQLKTSKELSEVGIDADDIKIVFAMSKKAKNKLQEDCKELGFDEEEYKDLNHEELVIYMAGKTLVKDGVEGEGDDTEEEKE